MDPPAIPLPAAALLRLRTDRLHNVVVPGLLFVKLRLLGWERRSLEAPPCRASIEGSTRPGQADAQGRVVFAIGRASSASEGLLEVESQAHGYRTPRAFALTELAGVDDPQGQRERLDNLGYIPVERPADDLTPARWAIEEFQCEHDLVVDGECGPATQAKLLEVHGH